jgi:hypothetical protein
VLQVFSLVDTFKVCERFENTETGENPHFTLNW